MDTPEAAEPGPAWTEVRALFETCLELPNEEREAHLAAVSIELRGEVESLLGVCTDNPRVLDPAIGHASVITSAESLLASGHTIGGHRLVRVLGRGGMSTVFLAEQDSPKRQVALKLLNAMLPTSASKRRFTNEATLLARLQHPGIAQIHSLGVHTETVGETAMAWPFLVMEYVPGARTLQQWVGERQHSDREQLELFGEMLEAVQHAHERGVVHRDLKPENILVDEQGHPKLIDFGIARTLANDPAVEQLTRPGDVIGTLHYMSPEQVAADGVIDTRTDVHALGVVLFEMLTGSLPFDLAGKSLPEVGRVLAEHPPRPLHQLRPDLDHDLGLILAKAMAKEPARRYSTAGALAEDLRRFLDHEPINARPPSLGYQLRMFARRRRGFVLATLAVVLVSVTGGISSFVYALRASDAESRAKAETDTKTEALRRSFDLAIRTVIELPGRLRSIPGATAVRRSMLSEAAEQLAFVEQNLEPDLEMMRSLAEAYHRLAEAYVDDRSGDPEGDGAARRCGDRARHYIDRVLAKAPNDRETLHVRFDAADFWANLAFNKSRDMESMSRELGIMGETIERLEQLPPGSETDRRRLLHAEATFEYSQSLVAMFERDPERQVGHLQRCKELVLRAADGPPYDPETVHRLCTYCLLLAQVHERRGDHAAACGPYAEASRYSQIAADRPNNLRLRMLRANVLSRYGYALSASGNPDEGEPRLQEAFDELSTLGRRDPENVAIATKLGLASMNLAEHFLVLGQRAEGEPRRSECYRRCKEVAEHGLEVVSRLLENGRDMQSVLVQSECRRMIAACEEALR